MPHCGWAIAVLVLAAAPMCAAPEGQWIVVTAPAFRQAIEPLCQQRKSQGLHVVIVQTTDVLSRNDLQAGQGHKLREHINKLCRDYKGPSYVLLVGALSGGTDLQSVPQVVAPALTGAIGRMKGQPSDNGYGCLDEGCLPTVAVGRFPARTEAEARGMVAKTLEYESTTRTGPWRRRLLILAGVPAFNPFADRIMESLALARLARLTPTWTGRVIYSNPQSPFCVPEALLHQRALQYVQEGEALTLYLGHSNAEALYGGPARYLDRGDWSRLRIEHGKGVFITLGCNGCQLKGANGEGYGLAAMRNANGPVAVIGSHGIFFAAMGLLAADGLFESTFAKTPPERLGDSWLAIKNSIAHGKIDAFTFGLLDAVDGDNTIPQATQRQEHLEMFLLLGDPALRLPKMPEDVEINTEKIVCPGQKLTVRGKLPKRLAGAHVWLTLERTVNSVAEDLEAVPPGASGRRDRVMLSNHERANRFVLAASESTEKEGRFQAMLEVPTRLPWPRLILRVYAANEREEGMAVQTLLKQSAVSNQRSAKTKADR